MSNSISELATLWESREDVLRKAAELVKSNPKLAESLEMTAESIGQCAEELTECCNSQTVSYPNELNEEDRQSLESLLTKLSMLSDITQEELRLFHELLRRI